jgi:hypothetical protein
MIVTKFNPRSFRHVISLAVFATIVVWGVLFFSGFFEKNAEMVNYFGFCMTTTAIIVAVLQSIKNHDWNRRHAATLCLKEFRDQIRPHTILVHKAFGYFGRDENHPISVDKIHEAICKLDGDGRLVRCGKTDRWELDEEKQEIDNAITEMLNLYEYIGSGIHQGVFDKEIVADLMASNIIKVANVFGPYITHINEDMYKNRKGKTWINIKTLGREFKEKYRDDSKAKNRSET